MAFAQIGPLTAAVEALATAVGAGIVLGSFVLGVGLGWRNDLSAEKLRLMKGVKYANIGLVVFIAILLPGAFLVRDAGDTAIQAVGAFAWIIGCAVYLALDMRAERQEKGRTQ